jgi:drug/metabolite transporter superfamily protein YnfA
VGLGLWNSWAATILVEVLFFGAGLWAYLSVTRARDAVGRYAFWCLMALLFFGWVTTMLAGAPPNVNFVAWGGVTMWLMVPWGWWADKHRQTL